MPTDHDGLHFVAIAMAVEWVGDRSGRCEASGLSSLVPPIHAAPSQDGAAWHGWSQSRQEQTFGPRSSFSIMLCAETRGRPGPARPRRFRPGSRRPKFGIPWLQQLKLQEPHFIARNKTMCYMSLMALVQTARLRLAPRGGLKRHDRVVAFERQCDMGNGIFYSNRL
jgi:hypothetical protein